MTAYVEDGCHSLIESVFFALPVLMFTWACQRERMFTTFSLSLSVFCFLLHLHLVCVLYTQTIGNREWREVSGNPIISRGASVVQEVEKSLSNQKVASSIPCRSVLEQDTEPLIAPDVQCAISVNVKCVYIVSRTCVRRFG